MAQSCSEWEWVREKSVAVSAFGQRSGERDGIDGDVFTRGALGVVAAGWSGQLEVEWQAVSGCPLGNKVGDDATVVTGVRVEGFARGLCEVNAVHPCITGEPDVKQVAKRLTSDGRREFE